MTEGQRTVMKLSASGKVVQGVRALDCAFTEKRTRKGPGRTSHSPAHLVAPSIGGGDKICGPLVVSAVPSLVGVVALHVLG